LSLIRRQQEVVENLGKSRLGAVKLSVCRLELRHGVVTGDMML